jgi:hypothetical protein
MCFERGASLLVYQSPMCCCDVLTLHYSLPGLPDLSWYNIPKRKKYIPNIYKIYQMATKCTKWPQNVPNGHKMYQMATKCAKWPQNVPNGHKMYQMATKCAKWPQNVPNGHKMYQMALNYTYIPTFSMASTSKIGGLKICHLKICPVVYTKFLNKTRIS